MDSTRLIPDPGLTLQAHVFFLLSSLSLPLASWKMACLIFIDAVTVINLL